MNFINHKFELNSQTIDILHSMKEEFESDYGKVVYYRTYSRLKKDGTQEHWVDTVIRVVNGIMSIRKNHMLNNRLGWNEEESQSFAKDFSISMFKMNFLPPGRGLWICGTKFVEERGSAALNNCGAVSTENLITAAHWTMNMLMYGVGIGYDTIWNGNNVVMNDPSLEPIVFQIPDSREGWCDSIKLLLESFINNEGYSKPEVNFDYSLIRKKGEPLISFGGIASGPEPLENLHKQIKHIFKRYMSEKILHEHIKVAHEMYQKQSISKDTLITIIKDTIEKIKQYGAETYEIFFNRKPEDDVKFASYYEDLNSDELIDKMVSGMGLFDNTRLIVDLMNSIGCCVVTAGIRRSAMISVGSPDDWTFLNLKNFSYFPERASIGWMSNNTVQFTESKQFDTKLGFISERIKSNGEPGFMNIKNVKAFGRVGKNDKIIREDIGCIPNPCGEINLRHTELCNLVEIFLNKFLYKENEVWKFNSDKFIEACNFATYYASTVSLLPTHSESTNKVIAENRRIGVSLSGIADVYDRIGLDKFTRILRNGYLAVRGENIRLANEAGVPPSIKITCVKPSGSISALAGSSQGIHFPVFQYAIRRMRVTIGTPIFKFLVEKGVPYELDIYDQNKNTYCFEFLIDQSGIREAKDVSMWEQFTLAATLQREWADNMVSCTIYFDKEKEGDQVEKALAQFAPLIKCVSMLPREDHSYKQAPLEKITKEQYEELKSKINPINWNEFGGSDGEMPKYCTSEKCEM